VQEVRRSGITEQIEVVTNGVLLDKMPDKLLEEIDKLTVSWYPVARYNQEIIESTRQKCKNQGVSLHIEHIDRFRRMQVREGIKDVDLVKKIFDSCLIAHTWNCQTFYDGFFYLCSRPIFTDLFIEKLGGPFQGLRHSDGLPLHAPNLKERLRRFVSSVNPLGSCRYCLGTVGLYYPHEQIASAERQNPEISAEPPEGDIDKLRLWYLLQWRKVERFLIKAIPSSRLSRILCLIQTATIGD
jgi:hypothetical protein